MGTVSVMFLGSVVVAFGATFPPDEALYILWIGRVFVSFGESLLIVEMAAMVSDHFPCTIRLTFLSSAKRFQGYGLTWPLRWAMYGAKLGMQVRRFHPHPNLIPSSINHSCIFVLSVACKWLRNERVIGTIYLFGVCITNPFWWPTNPIWTI